MSNFIKRVKKKAIDKTIIPDFFILKSKFVDNRNEKFETSKISILNTSLNSDNLGDEIINLYCNNILKELNVIPNEQISTHSLDNKIISNHDLKLITGTNLLTSSMNAIGVWKHPQDFTKISNVGLMGVGWGLYTGKPNYYTKVFLNSILSKSLIHAGRYRYTLEKLKSIGVSNVVNTACPTMWNLTTDFCEKIPKKKSENVVTTVTDYDKNIKKDFKMLDILLKNYNKVYVWIQGEHDLEYLRRYERFNNLVVIKNSLAAYTKVLQSQASIDYVGTRLHAGIHALNNKRRSIIIAIDNRATEIAKDTKLPIIERDNVSEKLDLVINKSFQTSIRLPLGNINKWKAQFIKH